MSICSALHSARGWRSGRIADCALTCFRRRTNVDIVMMLMHSAADKGGGMKPNPYKALALTVGIHFFIMFALTYIGVATFDHVYLNLNRFYMAVVMVAPMVLLMMLFMRHMYENRKLNYAIYAVSALLFLGALWGIRSQLLVGNEQFLRSMIPHHSIAIKTCEKADITDPEIVALCVQIVEAQQSEIDQMEDILDRLD
jgi:hypothetical protein